MPDPMHTEPAMIELRPFLDRAWRRLRLLDPRVTRSDEVSLLWRVDHARYEDLLIHADALAGAVTIDPTAEREAYRVRLFGLPVIPRATRLDELELILTDRDDR